jgi:hypothetical protein
LILTRPQLYLAATGHRPVIGPKASAPGMMVINW